MIMKESKSVTKDSICGMTVDEATALHAERATCEPTAGLEACEGIAQRFFEKLHSGLEIAADYKSRAPGTERRADVSF